MLTYKYKMATIQELKKEIEKIKKENAIKEKRLKDFEQKKFLEKELKDLKNPKYSKFKKIVSKGLRKGGKELINVLEAVAESQKPQRRRPGIKKKVKRQ